MLNTIHYAGVHLTANSYAVTTLLKQLTCTECSGGIASTKYMNNFIFSNLQKCSFQRNSWWINQITYSLGSANIALLKGLSHKENIDGINNYQIGMNQIFFNTKLCFPVFRHIQFCWKARMEKKV